MHPPLSSLAPLALLLAATTAMAQDLGPWPQHSMDRPKPPVVNPGPFTASAPAPSDAIVLFDGKSLAGWQSADSAGGPARWTVRDGYMEVAPGTGSIRTLRPLGDVQLHVEWMAPAPPHGTGQDRGNSGVIFMDGRYEVQVLDSWHNDTYADGQAGAVYGQYPPQVNASRPPGEWQTYDIVFHAPRFDGSGKVTRKARFTVLHNGILVQDDVVVVGPTAHGEHPPYTAHASKLPLLLQDHGHRVRYRNIWARELNEDSSK